MDREEEAARIVGGLDSLILSARGLLDALHEDVRSQGLLEAHDDAKALLTTAGAIAAGYDAYERLTAPTDHRAGA